MQQKESFFENFWFIFETKKMENTKFIILFSIPFTEKLNKQWSLYSGSDLMGSV